MLNAALLFIALTMLGATAAHIARRGKAGGRLGLLDPSALALRMLEEQGWVNQPDAPPRTLRFTHKDGATLTLQQHEDALQSTLTLTVPLALSSPITLKPDALHLRLSTTRGQHQLIIPSQEAWAFLGVDSSHAPFAAHLEAAKLSWRRLDLDGAQLTLYARCAPDADLYSAALAMCQALLQLQDIAQVALKQGLTTRAIALLEDAQLIHPQQRGLALCAAYKLLLFEPSMSEAHKLARKRLRVDAHLLSLASLNAVHADQLKALLPWQQLASDALPASPKHALMLYERCEDPQELLLHPTLSDELRREILKLILQRAPSSIARGCTELCINLTERAQLPKLLHAIMPHRGGHELWTRPPSSTALRGKLIGLSEPAHAQVFEVFERHNLLTELLPHYAAILAAQPEHPAVPEQAAVALLRWRGWRPEETTLRRLLRRWRELPASSQALLWGALLARQDLPEAPASLLWFELSKAHPASSLQERQALIPHLEALLALSDEALTSEPALTLLGQLALEHPEQAASIVARVEGAPRHKHQLDWLAQLIPKTYAQQRKALKQAHRRWLKQLQAANTRGSLTEAKATSAGGLSQSKEPRGALSDVTATDKKLR